MVTPFRVDFLRSAERDLEKILKKDRAIAQRILDKLKTLSERFDETIHERLTGSLKEMSKLRVGPWRVLYTVNRGKGTITVHAIGHRSDIYKV